MTPLAQAVSISKTTLPFLNYSIVKTQYLKLAVVVCVFGYQANIFAQNKNILWYDKPAANWNEALETDDYYEN